VEDNMSRLILTVAALFVTTSWAAAQPEKMTDAKLDTIIAGHVLVNCSEHICGNNGWGNGAEGLNPGSDNGGTAPSKFSGVGPTLDGNDPSLTGINSNPTTSSGR
jgi:hypothetical protein